jgi:hypothetical protein
MGMTMVDIRFNCGHMRRLRRNWIAVFAAIVLAMVGTMLSGPTAEAGKGWCRVDPVVIIDGQIADIFVGSTLSALTSTTGPISIVVTVPEETSTTHVISDLGFLRGYDFQFATSPDLQKNADGIPVQIGVYVPASTDQLPVTVYFAPRLLGILAPASADGHANSWVTLTSGI